MTIQLRSDDAQVEIIETSLNVFCVCGKEVYLDEVWGDTICSCGRKYHLVVFVEIEEESAHE